MATHSENSGPLVPAAVQSITTAGSPQQVFPAQGRDYILFVNTSNNPMWLTIDGSVPSNGVGIPLPNQGTGFVAESGFIPNNQIAVWCATAGSTFYAVEG